MPTSSFYKSFVITDPKAIHQIKSDDLCATLTEATGITWKLGADTCEPQSSGAVLSYWLTTSKSGLHTLIATNVFGEYVIDEVLSEQDIIDLVNKTEDLA